MPKYSDVIKGYPYLGELQKLIPTNFFVPQEKSRISGYAIGTRYDRRPEDRSVNIAQGMSPEEEAETRRHEFSHQAIDKSPNWSHIVQIQKPTKELHQAVGLSYPKMIQLEENMIRQLAPKEASNVDWVTIEKGLTPTQQKLIPYLKSHLQYGPQVGSFVGPDYDERELREGKGQNILPRFEFKPTPEERSLPGVYQRELTLSERIATEERGGYDLLGYMKKYGLPKGYLAGTGEHLTDEFKLPHHITFSDESIYSNEKTPGGKWTREKDEKWHYAPSKFVLTQHPAEELRRYFKEQEPESVLDLPKASEEDETTRDLYAPRWRDVVR